MEVFENKNLEELYEIFSRDLFKSTDEIFLEKVRNTGKMRLSISKDLALYLLDLLNSSIWYEKKENQQFEILSENGKVGIINEGENYFLRVEILDELELKTDETKLKSDFQRSPIESICQSIRFIRQKKISEVGVDTKDNALNLISNLLPENPREFSSEAWAIYTRLRGHIFYNGIDFGGNKFHFTKKYKGNRDCIFGFVKLGGIYQVRYFYYSNSGGNWHCSPGLD